MGALGIHSVPFGLEPLLSYKEWETIQGPNTAIKEITMQYPEFL